jgi:GNAT superfamily N-acetyltransferase
MKETMTMELQNQTKLFELYKVKNTLPKKEWPPEALLNSAISKCVWDNDKGHYVFLTLSDEKYSAAITNFINKLQDNDIEAGSAYVAVNYTQIIYVPEDTKTDMMGKLPLFGDIIQIKNDDFQLFLLPYAKGIMIHGINVNPKLRNKGLGSKLLNLLYDTSEELDIPLFLTPYPDDDNVPKNKIWDVINRLRNYYERLGFGPLVKMPLLWSNYEDKYSNQILM